MSGGVGEGRARIFKQASTLSSYTKIGERNFSTWSLRTKNIIFTQKTLDCQECNTLYDKFEYFAYEFCNIKAYGVN